jgi:hypothetical protein
MTTLIQFQMRHLNEIEFGPFDHNVTYRQSPDCGHSDSEGASCDRAHRI